MSQGGLTLLIMCQRGGFIRARVVSIYTVDHSNILTTSRFTFDELVRLSPVALPLLWKVHRSLICLSNNCSVLDSDKSGNYRSDDVFSLDI